MAGFFIMREGKELGPFTANEIKRMSASGALFVTDLVKKGQGPWYQANKVRGLELQPAQASEEAIEAAEDKIVIQNEIDVPDLLVEAQLTEGEPLVQTFKENVWTIRRIVVSQAKKHSFISGFLTATLAFSLLYLLFLRSSNKQSNITAMEIAAATSQQQNVTQNDPPATTQTQQVIPQPQITQLPSQPTGNIHAEANSSETGLHRGGNTKANCLACGNSRSWNSRTTFSDKKGYGLCETCGPLHNTAAQALQSVKSGYGFTPHQEQALKTFMELIQQNTRIPENDGTRGVKLMIISGKFNSDEWNTLTGGR